MNVIINITEISGDDQAAQGIAGLFDNYIKDLNFSFCPKKWKSYVAELRLVFEKVSMGAGY